MTIRQAKKILRKGQAPFVLPGESLRREPEHVYRHDQWLRARARFEKWFWTGAGPDEGGYYDDFEDFLAEDDKEEYFDCYMGADGSCGLAGTEECDFECPYRG